MKKFIVLPLMAISLAAFGASTKTTTSKTYSSETNSPALDSSSSDMNSPGGVIEEEEYDQPLSPDASDETRRIEQEKMEERNQNSSTIIESNDSVDYSDRTRTNRERHAINTGSDASDDQ